MSVVSAAYTVGVSAVTISTAAVPLRNQAETLVYNNGSVAIYVGGSDVTTSNGIPVQPGGSLGIVVPPRESLYAISGTASQNVRVLETA